MHSMVSPRRSGLTQFSYPQTQVIRSFSDIGKDFRWLFYQPSQAALRSIRLLIVILIVIVWAFTEPDDYDDGNDKDNDEEAGILTRSAVIR
jgi:hypothetical protein